MADTDLLQLHENDNLAVALRDLSSGEEARLGAAATIAIDSDVPRGHKVAIRPIASGAPALKFDQVIGYAHADIAPGTHLHTHNIDYRDSEVSREIGTALRNAPVLARDQVATFEGIVRADGRVATRNYIGVLTSVNCSATVAKAIARHFEGRLADSHPNVDGVVALAHGTGCGMGAEGRGMDILRRTLAGYARHPNFAGVIMVGLGCEANQIDRLLEAEALQEGRTFHHMTIQDTGGSAATVHKGIDIIGDMLDEANQVSRQTVPASNITLALQCGGSDAFSGITANPALGAAADLVVAHGGTAILAETPEIYGAENLLLRRAVSQEVGQKLIDIIEWWEDYTARNDGSMDNNPSPGNKAGGLTTILEKSLGAVAKGGTTNLAGVLHYAEPADTKGFLFMDSPGYDPVSVTGQVASGSNVVCFTTGRGSCYGCKPSPSLKLATNTPMYEKMEMDMDVNCGAIVDGTASVEQKGREIFEKILATASGQPTKSEQFGYGDDEFVPWGVGAVM